MLFANAVFNVFTVVFDVMTCYELWGLSSGERDHGLFFVYCSLRRCLDNYISLIEDLQKILDKSNRNEHNLL